MVKWPSAETCYATFDFWRAIIDQIEACMHGTHIQRNTIIERCSKCSSLLSLYLAYGDYYDKEQN